VPLYEYECQKCGRRTEKIENVDGPHLKKCPHCGGKVERLVAAPAIQFKGAGWYVTDYAKKSSGGDSEKSAAGAAETASKEKSSDSKETVSKDSKEKKSPKKK
jgi:putative FmdB family regulatory protein